jgi:prepilin-type N-terminal cleavage/methylation domain-containing protein
MLLRLGKNRMLSIKLHFENPVRQRAFTLTEMLVVVALAAMILISALGIYQRTRADASVILDRLEETRLADEVLQRIAEDIDRIAAPGFDATIQIRNKVDNGLVGAQLTVENKYFGGQPPQPRIYERVIWQSMYDAFDGALLLYRMHGGLNVEDKILEEKKDPAEQTLYIPVASGITFFQIQAVENQQYKDSWTADKPPKGVRIGISFAEPEEDAEGRWAVPEEKILYRTAAIDRTRVIQYTFKPRVLDVNDFLPEPTPPTEEPNQPAGPIVPIETSR